MIRNIGYTNFFKDKTILVTGGPGFMGKSIIEKFIRCLPFKKMYLIIRKKVNFPLINAYIFRKTKHRSGDYTMKF